jgi:hypothetical protein
VEGKPVKQKGKAYSANKQHHAREKIIEQREKEME